VKLSNLVKRIKQGKKKTKTEESKKSGVDTCVIDVNCNELEEFVTPIFRVDGPYGSPHQVRITKPPDTSQEFLFSF